MHSTFSNASLLAALLYFSGSQAVPTGNPTKQLVTRDDNPLASLSNIQTYNGALELWDSIHTYNSDSDLDVPFCGVSTHSVYGSWLVLIPEDSKYDSGGCGAGFLDNFRGRCGDITDWACDFVGADKTTAALTFDSTSLCSPDSGFQVIQAASGSAFPGIQCLSGDSDSEPETHPDSPDPPSSDGDDVGAKPGVVAPEPVAEPDPIERKA